MSFKNLSYFNRGHLSAVVDISKKIFYLNFKQFCVTKWRINFNKLHNFFNAFGQQAKGIHLFLLYYDDNRRYVFILSLNASTFFFKYLCFECRFIVIVWMCQIQFEKNKVEVMSSLRGQFMQGVYTRIDYT